MDGLSGFPSPQESDCDTFIAGHGSTALSTAIGVARAKKLKKEPGKVVAIIGDGAFTGGMVYEGMNNVSNLNNLIVVLNDNKMSISKNVGQMANYLTKLRTDPKYFRVKAHMETALECIPAVGTALVEVLQEGKKIIRRGSYHSTMFEEGVPLRWPGGWPRCYRADPDLYQPAGTVFPGVFAYCHPKG